MKTSERKPRYVDLTSDAGFKAVFADRGNKDLLVAMLNLLLPPEAAVKDIVEYLDRERDGDFAGGKRTFYDLLCEGDDGRRFIVELQKEPMNFFFERCMYYGAGIYHDELKTGEYYGKLCPVYLVGILAYRLDHDDEALWDSDHIVSHYRMQESRTGEFANQTISCTFAELGRFTKSAAECVTDRDAVFYMFKHGGLLDELPEELCRRPVAGILAEACEIAAFPQDKKLEYEKEMLSERDIQAICSYAHDEGERKGREEGLMEGERKGREEGLQEGRKEERLSNAVNFLRAGVPAETVAKATGLSPETVQDLAGKI